MRTCITVVAVALAVTLFACGEDEPTAADRAAAISRIVDDLPQGNIGLGSQTAPATLTIFTEVTDYRFLDWLLEQSAPVLRGPVASGRLRIMLRPLPGADADADAFRAARLVLAAGVQDRLWSLLPIFAREYVGYVDDVFEERVLNATEGLDRRRALRDADDERVAAAAERATTMREEYDGPRPPFAVLERPAATAQVLPLGEVAGAAGRLG